MTKSTVRIKVDHAGVGELLRSPRVRLLAERKAQRMAAAVRGAGITVHDLNPPYGEIPLPVKVVSAGIKRVRVYVVIDHPAGTAVEARHRVLLASRTAAHD